MKIFGPPDATEAFGAYVNSLTYCPHCGGGQVNKTDSTEWSSPGKGQNVPVNITRLKCTSCGHQWAKTSSISMR